MKYLQSLITLLIVIFCSGTLVTSCMESSKKVANVTDTIKSAKEKFNAQNNSDTNQLKAKGKTLSMSVNKKKQQTQIIQL